MKKYRKKTWFVILESGCIYIYTENVTKQTPHPFCSMSVLRGFKLFQDVCYFLFSYIDFCCAVAAAASVSLDHQGFCFILFCFIFFLLHLLLICFTKLRESRVENIITSIKFFTYNLLSSNDFSKSLKDFIISRLF